MRRISPAMSSISFALLIIGVACSDATGVSRSSPLAGVWDVTTALDTFTFEAGPPAPGCSINFMYCAIIRPTSGASLSGSLTITDDVGSDTRMLSPTVVSASFQGAFCNSIDYTNFTGCLHVGPSTARDYSTGSVTLGADFATDSVLALMVRGADEAPQQYPSVHFNDVKIAADSMYGSLVWTLTVDRDPPSYRGTFVAHRRR